MDDLDRLAALQEPIRRRLFEYVRAERRPVGREEAGDAVGIGRSLAAYHLDRLAEEGLLSVSYRRPEGRSGPGAGRPAKLYEPGEDEVAVTIPARDYEFAARLLAEAAEADATGKARAAVDRIATAEGQELGAALSGRARRSVVERVLRERGYEPFQADDGAIRLRNCPFHRLAGEHRELVCGMNLAFLKGVLNGLERDELQASLEPTDGCCCVALRPR